MNRKTIGILCGVAATVLAVVIGIVFFGKNDELTATTMRVMNFTGDVSLEADGKPAKLRNDMLMRSGNSLETQDDSYVDLNLDEKKAVGLDQFEDEIYLSPALVSWSLQKQPVGMTINDSGVIHYNSATKTSSESSITASATGGADGKTLISGSAGFTVEYEPDILTGITVKQKTLSAVNNKTSDYLEAQFLNQYGLPMQPQGTPVWSRGRLDTDAWYDGVEPTVAPTGQVTYSAGTKWFYVKVTAD